jgi:hypothetical protein
MLHYTWKTRQVIPQCNNTLKYNITNKPINTIVEGDFAPPCWSGSGSMVTVLSAFGFSSCTFLSQHLSEGSRNISLG